jgi:hypothetical protein
MEATIKRFLTFLNATGEIAVDNIDEEVSIPYYYPT